MSKYEELKRKYNNLIKQTLDKNRIILIESFVEYYGEKFRYIIEKRYNEITFIYYIDWNMIDLVVKEFIPKVDNSDKYVDFINFSRSRRKFHLLKIFEKKNNLPDNLIGVTNTSIVNKNAIVKWLFKALNSSNPRSYNYGNINHMDRLISFQILALSELAIIHEINHSITRDNLAYLVDDNMSICAVSKTGLSIDITNQNNEEKIIEELLNEKSSKEILKIFKSKGGDLSSFCLNIPLEYSYEGNLYLVDDFYTLFEEYIKIARISDNKNELVSRISPREYEEFVKTINMYYTEDSSKIELYKEKALPIIREVVKKMSENVGVSHDIAKDELSAYLQQLKNTYGMIPVLQNDEYFTNDNGKTHKNR